jgi:hypothetical protein
MTTTRFLWTTLAALGGVAAVIGFRATAQDGPGVTPGNTTVIEAREDGTLVERTPDGKFVRMQKGLPHPPGFNAMRTADGRMIYQYPGGPAAQDEESKKLLDQEQAAAQEARRMADNLLSIEMSDSQQVEQKKKLRDKLAEVFDLQQQRRNHEIAKIEDRLAKLKETLKKREAVKESIVDRRLETMTGGVDELGWEETFPQGPGAGRYPTLVPDPVPVPGGPGDHGGPTRKPLPPPVAPGPGGPPGAPPAPTAPSARDPFAPDPMR